MNKNCAKCTKIVYPTEELKCLDKVWHKLCFKCEVCSMTLTMKNYKGYNKLPYCNAHYPTTKHTQVADTPENRRISENTKIQSQVKYHAEFERSKGQKAAEVVTQASSQRNSVNRLSGLGSGTREFNSPYSGKPQTSVVYDSSAGQVSNPTRRQPGSIADYDPMNENYGSIAPGGPPAPSDLGYGGQALPVTQAVAPAPPAEPEPQVVPQPQTGMVCQALFDYTAADSDEVSFAEGDRILNCERIDEGWMTGTVEKNGEYGMLPANYVEPVN